MAQLPWRDPVAVSALDQALAERILVLDGAMGTMIQDHQLDEAGYRGCRLAGCHHDHPQKGNNDLLVLTQPELIAQIHRAYLEAGADLIETNTFNSTAIAQADYALENEVYDLNRSAAALAKAECARMTALTPGRPRFVVGVLGPTNRTASISPDVNNPGFRNVDFETLRVAYREAIRGLLDGGADLLMVETVFDTLNCKAALYACNEFFDDVGWRVPLLVSGTITDASGRTLTGQTPTAFYLSVRHAGLYAVGLNCALGATELRPHLAELSAIADTLISAHPNAGLPNAFGSYDESPEAMAATIAEFARAGLLNIVGGCCGTTPAHIKAIADAVQHVAPRAQLIAKAA